MCSSPWGCKESDMTEWLKNNKALWTNIRMVKVMVFPVAVCECGSWTIRKAESQRIDAFELRCWRRLLRVPRRSRSNKSILKEITPEYSLEGLMLKMKLQYLGHLMWWPGSLERPSCWERLRAGERGNRGWDGWIASPTQWMWVWANSGRQWRTGRPGMLQSMGSEKVGHNLNIEQQQQKQCKCK